MDAQSLKAAASPVVNQSTTLPSAPSVLEVQRHTVTVGPGVAEQAVEALGAAAIGGTGGVVDGKYLSKDTIAREQNEKAAHLKINYVNKTASAEETKIGLIGLGFDGKPLVNHSREVELLETGQNMRFIK